MCHFLFIDMLQVQKLLKLEEVEVKMGEEPEGEIIVGLSGQALRPPGKGATFIWINFLSDCVMFGQQLPYWSCMLKVLWLLGETSEEEGEAEEPETSTQEHTRLDWAHVWMEEGVHWHWWRVNLRDYSPRYSISKPFPFCSV